jgi:hypothetical protein
MAEDFWRMGSLDSLLFRYAPPIARTIFPLPPQFGHRVCMMRP